ncbi:MAG: fibrobacter succinogenes major paralogous domain-containing protein [Crocinitomicaceae bacterium]|nr:fibrobacter succinogenes major paralogous domain-containing protein [Crocinitomicaceae bacterium]
MKKLFLFLMVIISVSCAWSQGVKIGVGSGSPDASSMLDIESTSKGFLPPRMTTVERDAIVSPADGLVIFNTTMNCLNYRAAGSWYEVCGLCSPQPSIANAGSDQLSLSGVSATLSANTPIHGSGTWTVISGSGGSFQSTSDPATIFNGVAGSSYVLQWVITNNCGSTTDEVSISFVPLFTCGDNLSYSGINYTTAMIGGNCWFTKNLNIGTETNLNTNSSNDGTIEKYCYDGLSSNCNTWGALYQWNELMNYSTINGSQGICPSGWHVATDSEWGAAISSSPSSLLSLNSGVLCNGGNCGGNIYYANGSTYGYYWTSSEQSGTEAKRRIFSGNSNFQSDFISKNMGLSARCVLNY